METIPGLTCHAAFFEKPIITKAGNWFHSLLFLRVQSLLLSKNQINKLNGKMIQIRALNSFSQEKLILESISVNLRPTISIKCSNQSVTQSSSWRQLVLPRWRPNASRWSLQPIQIEKNAKKLREHLIDREFTNAAANQVAHPSSNRPSHHQPETLNTNRRSEPHQY